MSLHTTTVRCQEKKEKKQDRTVLNLPRIQQEKLKQEKEKQISYFKNEFKKKVLRNPESKKKQKSMARS